MKEKFKNAYMSICNILSELSECSRRKFGAVLVDPANNVIVATGYNGYIRGGNKLCGGDKLCVRDMYKIKSGTMFEVGCIHAEENALINASRQGVSTIGTWLFVNGNPCQLCARRMVQAGVVKVIYKDVKYPGDGHETLYNNNVKVEVV